MVLRMSHYIIQSVEILCYYNNITVFLKNIQEYQLAIRIQG